MSDTRPWFKTDVGYFDNPKVGAFLEESPRVPILHLRAIAFCRQHLTDGVFPVRRVAVLACATYCGSQCESHCGSQCDVCKASHAGLILRIDDARYSVHDYAEHQQTAEQVNKRKAAGQKAAAHRWGRDDDANGNANRITNRNASGNAEKRREEKKVRDDVAALCAHLADRIEANGSKRPTITKAWTDPARLLLDHDKRDHAEALRLIDWCQASDFWRPNVLSMKKFREKYDTLRLQSDRDKPKPTRNPNIPEGW